MIRLKNLTDCCGCTACVSICHHKAISMQKDKEGFLYPIINNSLCVECGLCEKVCPIIHRRKIQKQPNQRGYYALRIKDEIQLESSSSGGAFIAIANCIIKKGGVVCGAKYNEDCVVVHDFAEDMHELEDFMGSKYSQSDIRGVFVKIRTYLQNERIVLFSGTPCQVEGLRLFLCKNYDNLFTVDLVCHAVPSPKIFREYIEYSSKKLGSQVVSINMRYKKTWGWGHRYSYLFLLKNGKNIVNPSQVENWGRLYFSRLIDRPSCHDCQFTNYNRCGDITIADFWDDNTCRPDIKSEEGTSLCLVNTEKGEILLKQIRSNITLWEISKKESEQPCLLTPTVCNPKRMQFWRYYQKKGFEKTYGKYFIDSAYKVLKRNIKNMLKLYFSIKYE